MTEFWELKRPKVKPKTVGWLIAACLAVGVLVLLAIAGVLAHPDNSGLGGMDNRIDPYADLGYLGGQLLVASLLPILVVWLALYFIVVRRVAPERGAPHLAVLAVVGLIVGLSPVGLALAGRPPNDPVQNRIADQQIAAAMIVALDPEGAGDIDPTVKATGEAGELERLMKQMVITAQADHRSYLKELRELGFPNFLTGRRLAADPSLSKTRAQLSQAAALVAKYRALSLQRADEFKKAVMGSSLSGQHKAQVINMVEISLDQAGQEGGRIWELDAGCIAEYQAAVEDLAKARGRWFPQGDRVMFRRQADLDTYNQHIRNIQAKSLEGEQLKRDMQAKLRTESGQ